jgi:hypothetical protein
METEAQHSDDIVIPFRVTKSIGERMGITTYGIQVFDNKAPNFPIFTVTTSDPSERDRLFSEICQLVKKIYYRANAEVRDTLAQVPQEPDEPDNQ